MASIAQTELDAYLAVIETASGTADSLDPTKNPEASKRNAELFKIALQDFIKGWKNFAVNTVGAGVSDRDATEGDSIARLNDQEIFNLIIGQGNASLALLPTDLLTNAPGNVIQIPLNTPLGAGVSSVIGDWILEGTTGVISAVSANPTESVINVTCGVDVIKQGEEPILTYTGSNLFNSFGEVLRLSKSPVTNNSTTAP